MLNGVNLNYVVVLLVTGAVLMASVYHIILYLHRRDSLLASYSSYLWSTFAYCLFRTIVFYHSPEVYRYFNPDEVLQMISFALYIRFLFHALDLQHTSNRYVKQFAAITPYVIAVYLLLNTLIVNTEALKDFYILFKILARAYLLFIGLVMLVMVMRRRKTPFYRYLQAGAVSMILFGLVSSVVNLVESEHFLLGAISWLMFGFFSDVVFFSAAMGYRIRQEYREKEASLKQLMLKEAELQQKEIEKLKAVYETREEERIRIARDLHDDMGSTLSSIEIYSKVVATYLNSDPEKANAYLDKIIYNSRQLMENTSDLIWELQTNYGAVETIFERMRKTAVEMLSSANITPHVRITDKLPQLTIVAQKNCWLIFKEALNNVCKYSKAANCYISINRVNNNLVMSIRDDGVGFVDGAGGNGLQNMRSRAEELHGEFRYSSVVGSGTDASFVFPFKTVCEEEIS